MLSDDTSLNGDLRTRVAIDSDAMPWTPSPAGHVERKRLHRVGPAESGQVTSIVRYRPGASFPEHDHPEGEEIFVIDGLFSDHHGDATRGMHLLNPEGFRHAPFSNEGCVIFVKLRQYAGADRTHRRTDTTTLPWTPTQHAGVEEKVLCDAPTFRDRTSLERWAPGTRSDDRVVPGGAEVLVLSGELEDPDGRRGPGAWIRVPPGRGLDLRARRESEFYVKTGAVATLRTT